MSDKEDIFSTPESEARLDLIKHLIENSELVPLVRGMPGIGKSLLASRLQSGAPDNWVVCLFEADTMMQPERLLEHVARCNGLPDAKEDNIRRLVERFELMRKRGNVPVLLIDEAQQLPPTSLITLLRLFERQVGGGPLLSLVLFADEQIDMLLSTPQLQIMSPQSIQVIDLPPLTREEADSYMKFVLMQEGLDQSLLLDSTRMSRIYRDTGGAPGPLGSAIRKEVGELEGGTSVSGSRLSGPLLWAGLPLAAVVILLLLFQGPINRLFSPEETMPEGPLVAKIEQSGPASPGADNLTEAETAPIELPPPGRAEQAPQPPGVAPTISSTPEGPAVDAAASPLEAEAGTGPTQVDIPQEAPAPVSQPTSSELAQMPEIEASPPEPAVSPAEQPDTEASLPASPEPEVVGSEAATSEAVEPSPPEDKATAVQVDPSGLLKSSDWLDGQPKAGYTLQLLAVGNLESVRSTVSKYKLQEQAFSIQGERQGQPWYPLLWGVYPSREAALAALKDLPAELRKSGAWARSLVSLRP